MFRIAKENANRTERCGAADSTTWCAMVASCPASARMWKATVHSFAAVAVCLLGPTVAAQESIQVQQTAVNQETKPGFFIGPQFSTSYDTNIGRQPQGLDVVGAQIDQAALLSSFDHTYARQHVYAVADVSRSVYRGFPLYDATAQSLHAGVQSNFPNDFASDIKVSRDVILANQSDYIGFQRNLLTENRVDGWLRIPLAASWRAVLAAGAGRLRNSNPLDVPTNVDGVQFQGGVRYDAGTSNNVNLLARSLQARYPDLELLPFGSLPLSPYHERGIDLQIKWRFSGSSQVLGDIGYVERRSEDAEVSWRNFSGPIYDLSYIWTPGAKLRFAFLFLRAIGEPGDNDYLSAVKHTYRFTPSYQASETVRLEGAWEWNSIHYISIPPIVAEGLNLSTSLGLLASEQRNDVQRGEGLAALWTPEPWLQARVSYRRDVRGSTVGEFFNYTDRVTGLQVQARF